MTEQISSTAAQPIQDKAPKPPGLMPKNVQAWVMLGLAVLMVTIMWLTGGKKASTAPKSGTPAVQNPAAPSPQPFAPLPPASTSAPKVGTTTAEEPERKASESSSKQTSPNPFALNAADGKNYVIFEGTVLETVLLNGLDGQFTGPVECLITNDIYSHDRQHLLIPSGTKVLGEAKRVDTFGQTRLGVAFHRLIMPDGYSVSLDQFKGMNQIGDTALRDQVNNHYLKIFGASLAVGAIGSVAEAGSGGLLTQSGTQSIQAGVGQSLGQTSQRILDKFLNILPTVTIREGHRVKIYLSGDLAVPDYANHKMPSDL